MMEGVDGVDGLRGVDGVDGVDGIDGVEETKVEKEEKGRVELKIVEEIGEEWSIRDIVERRCPRTWEKVFRDARDELAEVDEILNKERLYYPYKKDLFRAFYLTPLSPIRLVLVGQDPYHNLTGTGDPQAIGLSFSVNQNVQIPSSLRNLYRELERTIPGFKSPNHGDLSYWAYQGIFLLNMCLTVRPNKPGSHGELWLGFINKVVNAVCENNPKVIFMLLGRQSQKIKKLLGERVHIVEAPHPSGINTKFPFVGSNAFIQVNDILKKEGLEPLTFYIPSN